MKSKKLPIIIIGIGLLSLAPQLAFSKEKVQCNVPVDVVGTTTRMQQKDNSNIIWLKNAPLLPNTIGYGPGATPASEITIVNGQYHIAQPQNGEIINRTDVQNQGASMLVRSSAKSWLKPIKIENIHDKASLSAALDAKLNELGCTGNVTLPFKLTARAKTINWSISGEEKAEHGTLENTDIIIIGLYTNTQHSNFFISPSTNIHIHFLVPQSGFSAHILELDLVGNAALSLPKS